MVHSVDMRMRRNYVNAYAVRAMHVHIAGTGVSLSLFSGLCSQTLPPSNYMYIELNAWLDASAALGDLHRLGIGNVLSISCYYTCVDSVLFFSCMEKKQDCGYVLCTQTV